jgi:hypothetical protein
MTSCYTMSPIVTPPTSIFMTTLTTIASIESSIYGPSSIFFANETLAYTTVDIF